MVDATNFLGHLIIKNLSCDCFLLKIQSSNCLDANIKFVITTNTAIFYCTENVKEYFIKKFSLLYQFLK